VRRAISAGDYSIDGYDGRSEFVSGAGLDAMTNTPAGIAIERKSISDLFNTLGQSRARFVRELDRLAAYQFAAIVVEAEWSEILTAPAAGLVRSQLDPKTIYRSVIAWQQRYPNVHWWMCAGRDHAEVTTFRILERWWQEREWRENERAKE
jgi:ERCC4-type nuclease